MHGYKAEKSLSLVGPLLTEPAQFKDPVIFVDGGAEFRQGKLGLAVGDGDSTSAVMDEPLSPNKNYSDLAYVLAAIPQHFQQLSLLGFLGGRRDHELLNFGEVVAYLNHQSVNSSVLFDDKVVCYGRGEWQLHIDQTFSLLCLQETNVQLTGACAYPIESTTHLAPLSSLGLSNEGHGSIHLKCDAPVLLFFPDSL